MESSQPYKQYYLVTGISKCLPNMFFFKIFSGYFISSHFVWLKNTLDKISGVYVKESHPQNLKMSWILVFHVFNSSVRSNKYWTSLDEKNHRKVTEC